MGAIRSARVAKTALQQTSMASAPQHRHERRAQKPDLAVHRAQATRPGLDRLVDQLGGKN